LKEKITGSENDLVESKEELKGMKVENKKLAHDLKMIEN